MQERLHYFAFSFSNLDENDEQYFGSVYVGFPQQMVSIPRLQAAKEAAGMPLDSVVVGLGYMGWMTKDEVMTVGQGEELSGTVPAPIVVDALACRKPT